MELLMLILCSMLGQLLYILLDVRQHLSTGEFNWQLWKKRNLAFSVVSLLVSGIAIILPYTQGMELTLYTAIMQGMALDGFFKTFKPK